METTATTLRNRLLNRARLRHLHVFVKIAELQTVKRASDAVGISQPTATQALADLEQLLEAPLFLRHSRGMSLTVVGAALLPLARRSLGLIDDTATQAAALIQGSNMVVRVAAISAAIGGPLGRAVPEFVRKYPDVLVQLQEADAARQAALVADADVDCAVCRVPAVLPDGWCFTPVWKDRFAIIAGPAHPFIRKRRIGMDELLSATWLVTPTSISSRAVFDAFFARAQSNVRKYNVLTASPAMVWNLLTQEPLLALLPLSIVERLVESGQLVEIAWSERLPIHEIGILAPGQGRRPALDRFVDFLQQSARG